MTELTKVQKFVLEPAKTMTVTQTSWLAGSPGKPAYCILVADVSESANSIVITDCNTVAGFPPGSPYAPDQDNDSLVPDSNLPENSTNFASATVCTPIGTIPVSEKKFVKKCFDAEPETSGRFVTSTQTFTIPSYTAFTDNPGWNAAAFSLPSLLGDGYSSFQIAPIQAAVVGFSMFPWEGVSYNNMLLGIYAYQDADGDYFFHIIRNGKYVSVKIPFDPLVNWFHIERRQGYLYIHFTPTNTFIANDSTEIYEDKTRTVNGFLKLDASLYIANDKVIDASISAYGELGVPGLIGAQALLPTLIASSTFDDGSGTGILVSQGLVSNLLGDSGIEPRSLLPVLIGQSGNFIDDSVDPITGLPGTTNALLGFGVLSNLQGETFLSPVPPKGLIIGQGVMAPLVQQFGLIGADTVKSEGTLPALLGTSTIGFDAGNPLEVGSRGVLPQLIGFSGQIMPFDFWLEGGIGEIGFDMEVENIQGGEPSVDFDLNGAIEPIDFVMEQGFDLDGGMDVPQFEMFVSNEHWVLDGGIAPIDFEADIDVSGSFILDGGLPGIDFEMFEGWEVDGGLPALVGEFEFTELDSFDLDGGLPGLTGELEFASPGKNRCGEGVGLFELDGGLPGLEMAPSLFELDGGIECLEFGMDVLNGLGEMQNGRTFVMNTNTGELTEYTDHSFEIIRQLQNKSYALRNGKLYRLNNTQIAQCSANAFFETHGDDRVFNDVGELVPNQHLKRNYGAYIMCRSQDNVGFILETLLDEHEGDRYLAVEELFERVGTDLIRVDFYRRPTAYHWGLGLRNMEAKKLSIMGVAQLIQVLEQKIWS